jgi:hypothetical protein
MFSDNNIQMHHEYKGLRTCSAVEFGDVILMNPDFAVICTLVSVYLTAFLGESGHMREV